MTKLLILLLILLSTAGVSQQATTAGDYVVLHDGERTTMDGMLDALATSDVVFVGENHDHAQGHALELAVLQGLYGRKRNVGLSMEMFERDVQPVLDEYLGGYISESSFLQASRPWPNYKTDYRPMVEFCKEKNLRVNAANAPRRYVSIVSKSGQSELLKLPKSSRAWLPKLPYAMDLPKGYEEQLDAIFGEPHGGSGGAAMQGMPSAENMKQAQAMWDVSMAESIGKFQKLYRRGVVIQVNGSMHSDSGYGIVDRLKQLSPKLKIAVVSIKPDAAYPAINADNYKTTGDYVIVTPVEKSKQAAVP